LKNPTTAPAKCRARMTLQTSNARSQRRKMAHQWPFSKTSGFQRRLPSKAWKTGIDRFRLVFRLAFNLDPTAAPSDGVGSLVGDRKQRESQMIAGRIRVSNKSHRHRARCGSGAAAEDQQHD